MVTPIGWQVGSTPLARPGWRKRVAKARASQVIPSSLPIAEVTARLTEF